MCPESFSKIRLMELQTESNDSTQVQLFKSNLSAFETINTDCLIQIFEYGYFGCNKFEGNMYNTLHNFAMEKLFPRKAKEIILDERYALNVILTAPLINRCAPKITLDSFKVILANLSTILR